MFAQLRHKFYSIDDATRRLLTPAWRGDFGLLLTAQQVDAVAQGRETVRFHLLPLLRANLHRITALSISLPESVTADVYSALDTPAPILERFELDMPKGWTGELDSRLFASAPGILTAVYLTNVAFPADRIRAFSNVHFLSFTFEGVLPHAERFFRHFSSLQELQIDLEDIQTDVFGFAFALPMVPGDPERSTLLEVQARMPAKSLFFAHFPVMIAMKIPDMQWDVDDKWSGNLPDDLSLFICVALSQPLYVCLQGVRVLLRSGRTNATRRVDMLSNEMLSRALLYPEPAPGWLPQDIDVFGVSTAQLVELSAMFVNLNAVEVLAIRCDEAGHAAKEGPAFPLIIPRKPLRCSAVRMLVLEDELGTTRLPIQAIADFIDKGIDRGENARIPLDLMVKSVTLLGELDLLGRRVQRIFACESDDTSGWLKGLVEHDGTRCNPNDYGRREAGEEARSVVLVAQICMDGVVRPTDIGRQCETTYSAQ